MNKIIEGLKAAIAGDYARVTIDGQHWVREDFAECMALRGEIERIRKAATSLLLEQTDENAKNLADAVGWQRNTPAGGVR